MSSAVASAGTSMSSSWSPAPPFAFFMACSRLLYIYIYIAYI
jgi:hypothetical protein